MFKSFETLLNDSKLFALDLLQRIEIICAVMNSRPVKRVTRSDSVFTLSCKELVIPLLSRAMVDSSGRPFWLVPYRYWSMMINQDA